MKERETEIVVYSKIGNFDNLSKASHIEQHEQLETEFKDGTKCRVRKTTIGNGAPEYVFTYKLHLDDEKCIEHSALVDELFFEGFKEIVEYKLLKTRYEFASDQITLNYKTGDDHRTIIVPDIKYEVDVYIDKDNHICEWCKIDIEVDAILDYLANHHPDLENIKLNISISHLPFEPLDTIMTSNATTQQKEFIDSLWKDHYRLSNK